MVLLEPAPPMIGELARLTLRDRMITFVRSVALHSLRSDHRDV
jgi:hypothetical protein